MICLKSLKTDYQFYANIDLCYAKKRLDMIYSDDTGYTQNSIRSMEYDEVEDALNKCGTEIDMNDHSLLYKYNDYPLSEAYFANEKYKVKNMNQLENGPETGGASGESYSPDISEYFMTFTVNSFGYSE